MQTLQPRYLHERSQLELTLKLISVEARTHTIKSCTGLSDDRIRKIYGRYFKDERGNAVRRRRGKSPQQVSFFVKNAQHQLQATTLFYLYLSSGLLRRRHGGGVEPCWPAPDIEYGHRVLRAFATYCDLHPDALYNFEWAWALLQAISRCDELTLSACADCGLDYVHDSYAIDFRRCPGCEIRLDIARRPGVGRLA